MALVAAVVRTTSHLSARTVVSLIISEAHMLLSSIDRIVVFINRSLIRNEGTMEIITPKKGKSQSAEDLE